MSTKEKKLTGYPTIDKTYTYEDYRREIDAIFFAYGKKTAIACIDETGVHNRIITVHIASTPKTNGLLIITVFPRIIPDDKMTKLKSKHLMKVLQ